MSKGAPVPFELRRRAPLSHTPLGRGLLALLRASGEDGGVADLLAYLRRHRVPFVQTEDLAAGVRDVDVLYVTRIQKERFENQNMDAYEQIRDAFSVTSDVLALLPQNAIVMHPLPRVEGPHSELPISVDADPRVIIFDQTEAGMYVRMGLLKLTCAVDRTAGRIAR